MDGRLIPNSSGHRGCALEPSRSRMQTFNAMAGDATGAFSRK